MTETRLTSPQEAAAHLRDALAEGHPVTLEVTAQDEATGGLLRLVTEIHDAAQARRVAIVLIPVGERGLRLRLTRP